MMLKCFIVQRFIQEVTAEITEKYRRHYKPESTVLYYRVRVWLQYCTYRNWKPIELALLQRVYCTRKYIIGLFHWGEHDKKIVNQYKSSK